MRESSAESRKILVLPVGRKELMREKIRSLRLVRSQLELVGGPGSCDGRARLDRIGRSGVESEA